MDQTIFYELGTAFTGKGIGKWMCPQSQSLNNSHWRWHLYPKEGTRSKRIDSNSKTGGEVGEWDTKVRTKSSRFYES